ncbi:hypothetical protein ZBT109_1096 [Zymobacter palmae]|uniref:Uncharacterized protein n=1 Tax=Zymobacter palmae TaxID=33074 RepID=A0A348HE05_9GAMM|nr:hypothetical protein ZBT109_1096 [Zymobacter palmae]
MVNALILISSIILEHQLLSVAPYREDTASTA